MTMRILNLSTPNQQERRTAIKELRILMLTFHFLEGVKTIDELAAIVGVSSKKVLVWTETEAWHAALKFWGRATDRKPYRDRSEKEFMESLPSNLRRAAISWTRMIETGADIDPRTVEADTGIRGDDYYPDEIFDVDDAEVSHDTE